MDVTSDIKECSKPWCKKTFPSGSQNKTCDSCRQHDRDNQKAWCKQKKVSNESKKSAGQKCTHDSSSATEERVAKQARAGDPLEEEDGFDKEDKGEFGIENDDDAVSQKISLMIERQELMFT